MWDLFQLHLQLSTLEQGKISDAASKSLSAINNEYNSRQTYADWMDHTQ